jgi:hypothetical protein
MGRHSKKATVRSYTKRNGTKVGAHKRQTTWSDSRKAAVGVGLAGLTFIGTAIEVGFEVATILLLIVAAVVGIIFTVANGGQRGTKRGKSVTRQLLAPQNKKARAKNRGAFTCRRCQGKFTNPLIHVCQIKWSKTKWGGSKQGSQTRQGDKKAA